MIFLLIKEQADGNTRVTLTMLNKNPSQLATLTNSPMVNARRNLPLMLMTSQPIEEPVDGNTKEIQTMLKENQL